ncbi:GntR family transcriptional regulator [Roseicyclus sp.]
MQRTRQTIGATTYHKIKHDIVFGILPPGSKIKLDDLKARYETSLSTLRETLHRLASEGFVDAPEQRGFFVKPVSGADLQEIADLRVLLECHALRQSILNGDTEWEGRVVAAHHKLHLMEQRLADGDDSQKETWKRYDWEFHQALISNCKSANVLSLHATLYEKYLRYQMLVLTNRGKVAAGEHRAMLDRALTRDADGASQILKTHINGGLEHTINAMP